MDIDPKAQERSVRTLIVSDVHLGCRYAQAENFLAYLRGVRPEQLFILGDFLDGWKLRAGWRWNATYSGIMQRLFSLAERGTEIYYAPGNHDYFLRNPAVLGFIEKSGLDVTIRDEFVIEMLDGRRFLALHGDKFDCVEQRHQWLSVGLTYLYEPLLYANWLFNRMAGAATSPYAWCAYIKNRVKSIARFFSHFERRLEQYVRDRHCHGVICGHIHAPGVTGLGDSSVYVNIGDWVENCTALVEHLSGEMVLESFFPQRAPQTVGWPASAHRHAASGAAGLRPADTDAETAMNGESAESIEDESIEDESVAGMARGVA
jgi:UDP-2,3-diacylglucosamine pyrophosphatase LpxH